MSRASVATPVTDSRIRSAITAETVGLKMHPVTDAETSAVVTPSDYSKKPGDVRRYGVAFDNAADDTAKLEDSISVAEQTVNDSQGATLELPTGTAIVSSQITLPNRVRMRGQNVRGSTIRADAAHTGPYVFNAVNGVVSMFGSVLENLNIDCNEVAGLGGILADAWQENSGLRGVLINDFKTYGLYFQNGYGGASACLLENIEIFGSDTSASSGAIYVEEISVVGGFKLTINNATISGGPNGRYPDGIRFESDSSVCNNVHFEDCETGFYFDGPGHHTLICCDGSSARDGVDNLVELASTFTGTLMMINCRRNGATNFLKDNRTGGLGTLTSYDEPVLVIGNASQKTAIRAKNTAKAWCAFNGTDVHPIVPTESFNVSSVTKTGTGNYRIILAKNMANSNCVPFVSCNLTTSGTHVSVNKVGVGSFDVKIFVAGVATDATQVSALVFGL